MDHTEGIVLIFDESDKYNTFWMKITECKGYVKNNYLYFINYNSNIEIM